MVHVLKPREAILLFIMGKVDYFKVDVIRPSDFVTTDIPCLSMW